MALGAAGRRIGEEEAVNGPPGGFTGQVISAMLDVAGWARPWDTENVVELNEAMTRLDAQDSYGEAQR